MKLKASLRPIPVSGSWPRKKTAPRNRSEQEIAGYRDVLNLIHESFTGNLEVEPLIAIPVFIHDFLCIHPFNDGNGRMSCLKSNEQFAMEHPRQKFLDNPFHST